MFRFTTAGESHGRGLVAVLEGIPAGLPLSAERINVELKRRMGGYGRGARMKIESDQIEWLAGVRAGETLGSPIAMLVWNRDWEHWQDVMAPEGNAPGAERRRQVTRPRPGHADLAGALTRDGGAGGVRRGVQGAAGTVRRGSRFSRGGIGWRGGEIPGPDPPAPELRLRCQPGPLPRPGGGARDHRPYRRGQGGG